MDRKATNETQRERAQKKIGRNHEIRGMLKAGVSARQIAKDFKLSYTGAKKLCAKLKTTGNCDGTPGSGRNRKTTDRSDRFIVKHSQAGTPTKKQLAGELEATSRCQSVYHYY